MRNYFILLFLWSITNYSFGQKTSIYAENLYLEGSFVIKNDSITIKVSVISHRNDTIYLPFSSSGLPRYEICNKVGKLNVRIGATTCHSGLPLEFMYQLGRIMPKERVEINFMYPKESKIHEILLSFDFISSLDYRPGGVNSRSRDYFIKSDNYASLVHVLRSTYVQMLDDCPIW